jgi:hypothetical protein
MGVYYELLGMGQVINKSHNVNSSSCNNDGSAGWHPLSNYQNQALSWVILCMCHLNIMATFSDNMKLLKQCLSYNKSAIHASDDFVLLKNKVLCVWAWLFRWQNQPPITSNRILETESYFPYYLLHETLAIRPLLSIQFILSQQTNFLKICPDFSDLSLLCVTFVHMII